MRSRPFRPVGLPIYVARVPRLHSLVATLATLPGISEIPFLDCSFAIISSNGAKGMSDMAGQAAMGSGRAERERARYNGANGMNTPCWETGGWTALAAW
jgi:hypothetical protein